MKFFSLGRDEEGVGLHYQYFGAIGPGLGRGKVLSSPLA